MKAFTALLSRGGDALGGLVLVAILSLALLPLPAVLLDLLLGLGLCLSLLVFLVAVFVERPLDFSAFPSVLVLVTMLRLSLNIASTRMILLRGGEGHDAAGKVIRAFGDLAVGGNFVVGAVVFLILVLVNFIVITKGADRISEVAARFTLDSLPGKQMAIDSDLVAGLLTEAQAKERRKTIQAEAEFHGAMDGASKFVRGDAVAGLVIVAINIFAGIVIGVGQHDLSFAESARTYSLLSIGDGLVSQLPALLVSTGAALLVTRDSSGHSLMPSVHAQLFGHPKATTAVAVVLGTLALVPGMPHLAFAGLAIGAGLLGRKKPQPLVPTDEAGPRSSRPGDPPTTPAIKDPTAQKEEIEALLPLDLLALEIGVELVPLVDRQGSAELLSRIAAVRKQLALEFGFIIPPVHIRDDLRLPPGAYRLLVSGVAVGEGEVRVGRMLAIDPEGSVAASLGGERVIEPSFGLPAAWISTAARDEAQRRGCTVVDPSTVVATHLTELVRRHASELLGRREAQELVELAGKQDAKVVEELLPHLMSLGEVIKVLRNLLAERVSVRDVRSILECLADHAQSVKDPNELTELVRQRLARQITAQHKSPQGELMAYLLDPTAEELLLPGRHADANTLSKLAHALAQAAREAVDADHSPVVLVAPEIRRPLAAIAKRHIPGLFVLSFRELDSQVPLKTLGLVRIDGTKPAGALS